MFFVLVFFRVFLFRVFVIHFCKSFAPGGEELFRRELPRVGQWHCFGSPWFEVRKGFVTMIKKLAFAALAVVGVFVVLSVFAPRWLGYAKDGIHKMQSAVNDAVPPETKIERLRQEVNNLTPDMHKHRAAIAGEMVAVKRLKESIGQQKDNLAKKEALIRDLRAELKTGNELVSINHEMIPRKKVEEGLTRQWEAFKLADNAIKAQEELLRTREESLQVALQKLETMESKRKELQAKVERMELELRKGAPGPDAERHRHR